MTLTSAKGGPTGAAHALAVPVHYCQRRAVPVGRSATLPVSHSPSRLLNPGAEAPSQIVTSPRARVLKLHWIEKPIEKPATAHANVACRTPDYKKFIPETVGQGRRKTPKLQ